MIDQSQSGVKPDDLNNIEWLALTTYLVRLYGVVGEGDNARCGCGNPECGAGPGKHPVEKGWPRVHPELIGTFVRLGFNLAVLPGAVRSKGGRRLVVVEPDVRPGKDGRQALRELEAKLGKLPETVGDDYPDRASPHLWFWAPADFEAPASLLLGPGLELLSGRHLVNVAPSKSKDGRQRREWVNAPWERTPAILPPAWVEHAVSSIPAVNPAPLSKATCRRNNDDPKRLAERIRAYMAKVAGAVSGKGGHAQTYKAACALVHRWGLSPDEALPFMREFNSRCEPAWSERQLEHKLLDAVDGNRHGDRQPGYQRGYLRADRPLTLEQMRAYHRRWYERNRQTTKVEGVGGRADVGAEGRCGDGR